MKVLVAFSSRHGATQGIAERIASALSAAGHQAAALPVRDAGNLDSYDAFVVGSAVYMFHWLKEATKFVRHNRTLLESRPLWLFSSGPLGTETTDAKGRDLLEASEAREMAGFQEALQPRGHAMFYGAYAPGAAVGLGERFVAMIPAARKAMPEGDFRDWDVIDAWAAVITEELAAEVRPNPPTP